MKRMLINATHEDEVRAAIVDGSRLIDLDIERPDLLQNIANIYKGKISSIEPSLGAVFVDYDEGRHGFLPLKEISPEYFLYEPSYDQPIDIRSVLKVGQELVVQVEKEERGTKGAALTTFISLAGSYLVLMPNNPKAGGISRRIDGEDREELREAFTELPIPESMGLIIRTAGVGRSAEELSWDLQVLLRYWEAVKQAAIARPGPYLIHQESDVIIRAIRDYLRHDIGEVIIDEPEAYARAKNYITQIRPDFAEKLKLYSDAMPLFSRFHIEQQIESAYQREVQLPSGGSIVIDHSEALVAIDINSARATKGGSIEETAYNTNLEAAEEIARQLRIRDIGGLIVIDFIDMIPSTHQRDVESCLRNALRQDRARVQIGRISRFGLLEMSRQRLRTSLRKSTRITCPRCEGQGAIRTVESIATSVIHLLQEQSLKGDNIQLQVQLPIDVSTFILNEKRDAIEKIEQLTNAEILIIPNEHLFSPQYYLKQTRSDPSKQLVSYKLVKIPKPEIVSTKRVLSGKLPEPAITQFLTSTMMSEPPPRKKPTSQGLIKRLWEAMFGSEKETPKVSLTSHSGPILPSLRDKTQGPGSASPRRKAPPKMRSAQPQQRRPQQQQRSPMANNRNKTTTIESTGDTDTGATGTGTTGTGTSGGTTQQSNRSPNRRDQFRSRASTEHRTAHNTEHASVVNKTTDNHSNASSTSSIAPVVESTTVRREPIKPFVEQVTTKSSSEPVITKSNTEPVIIKQVTEPAITKARIEPAEPTITKPNIEPTVIKSTIEPITTNLSTEPGTKPILEPTKTVAKAEQYQASGFHYEQTTEKQPKLQQVTTKTENKE